MHNGYNTESVGVTENGNYDGKLCANKNINKEATVNKVSENNGKQNDNEVSLDVNQVKLYKVSNSERTVITVIMTVK